MSESLSSSDKISSGPEVEPQVGSDSGTVDHLNEAPLHINSNEASILYRLLDDSIIEIERSRRHGLHRVASNDGPNFLGTRERLREKLTEAICVLREGRPG